MAGLNHLPHHAATILFRPIQDVDEHPVRHVEARDEGFRSGPDQTLKCFFIPGNEVSLRGLAFDELLSGFGGLFLELQVFDDMLRGLSNHPALVIEAFSAGPARDLVKIARGDDRRFFAVVFAETGQKDRADGHVDADSQGVGSANYFEESLLCELFHENPILRKEAGMMKADSVLQPFFEMGAVGAVEPEAVKPFGDRLFFRFCADIDAGEILGALCRVGLGEVNDVEGAFILGHEVLHRLRQRTFPIVVFEGNGAFGGFDRCRGLAVEL